MLPKNRLPIVCDRVGKSLSSFYSSRQVFSGLMATIFLAALDQVRPELCLLFFFLSKISSQTIVATALPTIVNDLGGGADYSWVGR